MNDKHEVTLADLDRTLAETFGHAPPITEAQMDARLAKAFGRAPRPPGQVNAFGRMVEPRAEMTLEEAHDISMGHTFHRPGITEAMGRQAREFLAEQAVVAEAESSAVSDVRQQELLEAARGRVASAAAAKGRTQAQAAEYAAVAVRYVQESAVRNGRSFDEVLGSLNALAAGGVSVAGGPAPGRRVTATRGAWPAGPNSRSVRG